MYATAGDIVEAQWNVKAKKIRINDRIEYDIVEAQWNVKQAKLLITSMLVSDIVEAQWNVKAIAVMAGMVVAMIQQKHSGM